MASFYPRVEGVNPDCPLGSAYCFPQAAYVVAGSEDENLVYNYRLDETDVRFDDGLIRVFEWYGPHYGRGFFRGFADTSGKLIIKSKAGWSMVRGFSNGRAPVRFTKNFVSKWGFIDTTGKEVIPFNYDVVAPFSEGVAVVTKFINGVHEYFVIDPDGNERPFVWE